MQGPGGTREKKNIINHKLLLYISNQIFPQIYISQSIHCTTDRTHRIDSLSADRSTFLRLVPSRIHSGLTNWSNTPKVAMQAYTEILANHEIIIWLVFQSLILLGKECSFDQSEAWSTNFSCVLLGLYLRGVMADMHIFTPQRQRQWLGINKVLFYISTSWYILRLYYISMQHFKSMTACWLSVKRVYGQG